MLSIPQTPEDFTADWLNRALSDHLGDTQVTSCQAQLSETPGQTAEVVLINVNYSQSNDLPSNLVAKITSFNQVVIDNIIAHYDQYYRETSFYREFPEVGISVPYCLYVDHNPDTQAFIILMQDLAPSESPSWAISTQEVIMALDALPAFHARWWNEPNLRTKDWMVQYDNRPFFETAISAATGARDTLTRHYGLEADLSIELMAVTLERIDAVLTYTSSRPYTFVHGDYHAKQMFFPTAAGGKFAVIDWQFPFVAQGAWDFARLEAMCLETTAREIHEPILLESYLNGLRSAGVKDYDMEDLEADYRIGLSVSQMIMSIAHNDTDVRLLQEECDSLGVDWRDAMLLRTQRAIDDWDVIGFIKSL